jgi:hypothetical protein
MVAPFQCWCYSCTGTPRARGGAVIPTELEAAAGPLLPGCERRSLFSKTARACAPSRRATTARRSLPGRRRPLSSAVGTAKFYAARDQRTSVLGSRLRRGGPPKARRPSSGLTVVAGPNHPLPCRAADLARAWSTARIRSDPAVLRSARRASPLRVTIAVSSPA